MEVGSFVRTRGVSLALMKPSLSVHKLFGKAPSHLTMFNGEIVRGNAEID
jgi:hypothetical protein